VAGFETSRANYFLAVRLGVATDCGMRVAVEICKLEWTRQPEYVMSGLRRALPQNMKPQPRCRPYCSDTEGSRNTMWLDGVAN